MARGSGRPPTGRPQAGSGLRLTVPSIEAMSRMMTDHRAAAAEQAVDGVVGGAHVDGRGGGQQGLDAGLVGHAPASAATATGASAAGVRRR